MKLFIIGNGFDKAHGFKTGYEDFKEFLKKYDYSIDGTFFLFDFFNNEDESLWSDFENRLGEVDYEGVGAEYSSDLNDDLSDKEWDNASSNNRYFCEVFEDVVDKFKPCLCQAVSDFVIDAVDYNKSLAKTNFSKLFSSDDLFVTFNYTKTLQRLYGIAETNILHLHGVAYRSTYDNHDFPVEYEEDPSVIFGHGDVIIESDDEDFYEQNPFNPHEILQVLPALLKKDYQNGKLEMFLEKYKGITEIQIIGHGLGKVDSCYFKQINDLLPNLQSVKYFYYCNDPEPETKKLKKLQRYFPNKEIETV